MATTYNTGNAIGSADPRDAYDNASNFDEFSNSSAQGFTDRRGVSRKTITGATAGYAAFNVTGAWTTATAYNVNDIWSDSGTFYLVLTDYTSGASAAADIAGGNVIVHQPKDWVVPIETVSDLRAFEPSVANQQIELLGHTNPGVGGGIFWHDASDTTTADDNGVTIVTAGGKRWKRRLDGFVTPEMFGLTSASTPAESKTIIEAAALLYPVRLVSQSYTVTDIEVFDGQTIVGLGTENTQIIFTSTTAHGVRVDYTTGPENRRITLGGFRIYAQTQTTGIAGFSVDTCADCTFKNIEVENAGIGVRERACWANDWQDFYIKRNGVSWKFETGVTGGVPTYRFGIHCSGNDYGMDIESNGISSTTFVGGGIERCQYWGMRANGGTNRAVKFLGFNFEDNGLNANERDIIIGNTDGVSNFEFDTCQFTKSGTFPHGNAIAADLTRGSGVSFNNCNYIGSYLYGADIASTFGSYQVRGAKGLTNWCESATTGVDIANQDFIIGKQATALSISSDGTVTHYHLNNDELLKSRRTTESYVRYALLNSGRHEWHPFNTASADCALSRKDTRTIGIESDGFFRFGAMATGSRVTAATAGAGAMYFDTSLNKPLWSDGANWRDASGTIS